MCLDLRLQMKVMDKTMLSKHSKISLKGGIAGYKCVFINPMILMGGSHYISNER